MNSWSRRRFIASSLSLGCTGCQFVRLGIGDPETVKSVGEALKATKIGAHPLDGPKRVAMKIAILQAPLRDSVIDQSIWGTADDQVISSDLQQTLRNNGLKVALLRSSLPMDVEELLKRSGPAGQQVEPLKVNQPINEPTKIAAGEKRAECSILMDTGGKVQGKSYRQVSGFLRIAGQSITESGIVLKIVPELHHGDISSNFASATSAVSPFEPAQLTIRSGQKEELIRELTTEVPVEPSQYLVIGLDTEREGSLGWFLLTDPPTSDQDTRQRLILIQAWNASREPSDMIASKPSPTPRLTRAFEQLKPPLESRQAGAGDTPASNPSVKTD